VSSIAGRSWLPQAFRRVVIPPLRFVPLGSKPLQWGSALARYAYRKRARAHRNEAEGPSRIQIEPAARHELEIKVAVDQPREEAPGRDTFDTRLRLGRVLINWRLLAMASQVRFTPESGHWRAGLGMSALCQKQTLGSSFDHRVDAGEHDRRNVELESLGGRFTRLSCA